jgi:branched-chain amino acid aminotransferase
MSYTISITKTEKSKIDALDFNNIPLGTTFTDHMFICDYENGIWLNPRIEPLRLIPTHPAAMALHYGQAIFEGMKAYKNPEGTPMLFRPEKNASRFNKSADRMGMPNVPEELFIEGLKELVAIERNWIPPQQGSALYLRPFMYADEAFYRNACCNKI